MSTAKTRVNVSPEASNNQVLTETFQCGSEKAKEKVSPMSLSDLASLGSVVSGFAVLISLIYLALQVRQTERNQQISIRHSRVTRTVELHLALADPAVAVAWLHGLASPREITQTEL